MTILQNVPKIGFHKHMCPFPGSLHAALEYIGDPCDYDYLMGVTGAAFRRFFEKDDGGNIDLLNLAPEPDRRAFWALNRDYSVAPPERDAMIAATRACIDRGVPVIAFGIIGPPEAGLVTGYDRDGEVLYGYSYFQDTALPGYYEQTGWFEGISPQGEYSLIVIGDKRTTPPPAPRTVLATSLAWAVDLARAPVRPERPQHASGLAAHDAWAAALEVDADYPADKPDVLATRTMVHGDQTCMLMERGYAARFLRLMAPHAPEAAEELAAAATLYDQVAGIDGIWLWGENMGPEVGQALANRETRLSIASAVRQARAQEAQAVEHLEAALRAM
ncbi:MAG: hypothetical protein GX557_01970 [Chloroflexi bacterium]|nr:hypothetical protein [Chloroflexota bacterium]